MWPHIAECRRCCCCRLRHCRHNGLIRPIDIILRIFTIIRLKTTTKTTATTMHEWLKYHCGDIRLPFFLLNQWICKLYIFITRACMCACELSHEWTKDLSSSFFLTNKSTLWAKKHVQQFTCNKIYIDKKKKKKNTCSMFIFRLVLSRFISMFNICYVTVVVLFFVWLLFFSFSSLVVPIECVGENCKWQCLKME